MIRIAAISAICFLISLQSIGQTYSISGKISHDQTAEAFTDVQVIIKELQESMITDENGIFHFPQLEAGKYTLVARHLGFETIQKEVDIRNQDAYLSFSMRSTEAMLNEVTIEDESNQYFGMGKLRQVEGTAIYASKKTEVIHLANIGANIANNVSRQIFSRVPGLNVWESDGAGLQLGIGARGLSPKRTANFNTRQNGYDIAADALGYPESYYTPPPEAVDRIEIVRGAASLQYGTQFGGMVNFVFKEAPEDQPLEILTRQTYGSWNFYNNFSSLAGSKGKFSYYTFYQFKRGDGWRPNSGFSNHMYFGSLTYRANDKLKFRLEYTRMNYLAQQAGGLTDQAFRQDPRQSFRSRNWFDVNWNLLAFNMDYDLTDKNKFNMRMFGNYSGKNALGKLDKIYEADIEGQDRELLQDQYRNFGIELRDLQRYSLGGNSASLLMGMRYFQGQTNQRQGAADNGSGPNFQFNNPQFLEGSSFNFPEKNLALFAENVFNIGERFTLTPGLRFEYIHTEAFGYYTTIVEDFNGNELTRSQNDEVRDRSRSFVLFGLGGSYKPKEQIELYANFSQNYRSITFSDIRVTNINFAVDPDIRDERGWNADIGMRGEWKNKLNYDVSLFAMRYNDRIGHVWDNDESSVGNMRIVKKIRKNIGEAQTFGLESFVEMNIWKGFFRTRSKFNWTVFANLSLTHARYVKTVKTADGSSFEGNKVELVPPAVIRTGSSIFYDQFKFSLQYSYTAKQYTDASNQETAVSSAVIGPVPAFHIVDLSASYQIKFVRVESGINNLFNNMYYTRRAESYPGPGIIPADGRSFYLTLQFKFDRFKKNK